MYNFRFGDGVRHEKYGRCLFGSYLDEEGTECVIWDGMPGRSRFVTVSNLTPDDPHFRQIDGKWYRVYGALDTEAAKEWIGKPVYYTYDIATLTFGDVPYKLEEVHDCSQPYILHGYRWNFIDVPLESEEKK